MNYVINNNELIINEGSYKVESKLESEDPLINTIFNSCL